MSQAGAAEQPAAGATGHAAGDTPEQAYTNYLHWLAAPAWEPQAELLTDESRAYVARFPMSKAYRQFILLGEYGKAHRLVTRGDRALVIFTGTPFASPHFLRRQAGRWQVDIAAEVRNTREHVGGNRTWSYRGVDDEYTAGFGDLLVDVDGYRRFREGDNRALPVRATPG